MQSWTATRYVCVCMVKHKHTISHIKINHTHKHKHTHKHTHTKKLRRIPKHANTYTHTGIPRPLQNARGCYAADSRHVSVLGSRYRHALVEKSHRAGGGFGRIQDMRIVYLYKQWWRNRCRCHCAAYQHLHLRQHPAAPAASLDCAPKCRWWVWVSWRCLHRLDQWSERDSEWIWRGYLAYHCQFPALRQREQLHRGQLRSLGVSAQPLSGHGLKNSFEGHASSRL